MFVFISKTNSGHSQFRRNVISFFVSFVRFFLSFFFSLRLLLSSFALLSKIQIQILAFDRLTRCSHLVGRTPTLLREVLLAALLTVECTSRFSVTKLLVQCLRNSCRPLSRSTVPPLDPSAAPFTSAAFRSALGTSSVGMRMAWC